jgi:hypothetical protein
MLLADIANVAYYISSEAACSHEEISGVSIFEKEPTAACAPKYRGEGGGRDRGGGAPGETERKQIKDAEVYDLRIEEEGGGGSRSEGGGGGKAAHSLIHIAHLLDPVGVKEGSYRSEGEVEYLHTPPSPPDVC